MMRTMFIVALLLLIVAHAADVTKMKSDMVETMQRAVDSDAKDLAVRKMLLAHYQAHPDQADDVVGDVRVTLAKYHDVAGHALDPAKANVTELLIKQIAKQEFDCQCKTSFEYVIVRIAIDCH